ncbi:PREDICTED: pentatricopeptide repeat-containing protein At2g29760, chloroplastic-like isoform X2 [Tarenaya hassleriana]|uniref:pentatricopeptide repeat-containing protein At2g29760, chloroplastic-like isoform X2 n=1 Tax=Tarenaya hassleriana TaxID=28532 RepID=UPI00053C6B16|nr:PREDICTED: pentatricopeptide repeat-containing protein At2g29760, chloroplastic-like isoform X2 [Tarenaya hassleriana]
MQNPAASAASSRHYFLHNDCFSLLTSSKTFDETRQLHGLSLKTGTFINPSVSSRLLSRYTAPEINNLRYARSVFERIPDPSLVLWNMIIKCYIENHRSHDAISLFCLLVREFPPDNFTFPCVIKGCSRLNAVEEGKQIHGFALKLGFALDKFVQSSLVSLYSKCGSIESACKVFDNMAEKDLVTWNSLIDGYARSGQVEIALKVFDEMPERDSFSWTALLDGFSKSGKIEDAREIFSKMPNKSLVSWNAMINGYMKSGDPESARRLFNRMPSRDLVTWNSIIAGYEINGRFKEAFRMFFRMLEHDFKPSDATLVSVISAVSESAILSWGTWIHSYMIKNGIEPGGVIGTLLIEMYSKCGSIENALSVFQVIRRKKLGHWNSIIAGLGMHGMANKALELFNKMRERDVLCRTGHLEEAKDIVENMPMRPNKVILMSLLRSARIYKKTDIGEYAARLLIEMAPETTGSYVLLSNMYASEGKWEKVSEVRERMKKKGIKKEAGWSSIEHEGVIHRFVVGDRSHLQTEEIYVKLNEMRERLKAAGHIPDTTQVLLHVQGEEEKEAELEIHSERLAIAYGLINTKARKPIRVVKNLTVCNDCHNVTKLLSRIYKREIIVRDNTRFHHFRDGSCSCKDFW